MAESAGAVVLLHTRQLTFLHMVPWLLLVASLLFGISGPVSRWLRRRSAEPHAPRTPAILPLFFVLFPVCFYIGYFGAGAGFLLMAPSRSSASKRCARSTHSRSLAACLSNFCAVLTFIVSGAIVWQYCLVSMVFAAIGGYVGAQYARRMNPAVLRTIVVVTGCAMAAYFFWKQS